MAGIKSSKLETEKRIFTIQGWITTGVPDYLILKNIEQNFKNSEGVSLSRVQSRLLVRRAYDVWHKEQLATVEEKRSLRIAELKQDVRSMGEEFKKTPKGMAVLLAFKKEISRLEALYPARVTVIQGDKDKPLVITDGSFGEEKEARLQALLLKAGALNLL